MRLTFLIGNGFDLNLGLKTKYEHFLPIYCGSPSPRVRNQEIPQFKKLLENDSLYTLWADFERALGAFTAVPPLHQQRSLRICLQDFKQSFAQYLQAQENQIDFDSCAAAMADRFFSDLVSYLDYVEPHIRNTIRRNILNEFPKSCSILNFNYTTILDRLLPFLNTEDPKRDSIQNMIHVHGTHSSGMMMGVDNIDQVANPDLFTHPLQRRLLLKPLLNQQSGPDNDYNASRCIERSDTICVFGMSLGETDMIWWQRVGQWLSGSARHQLLIFARSPYLNPLFFEDILDCQNAVQDLFFSRTDIPQEQRETLRDQVHVALNSVIFHLEPTLIPSRHSR